MGKEFATAINCIDGRTQEPVAAFLKKKFAVDYVDMVTEPGPNKILAQYRNKIIIASIKKRVKISIEKHNSKIIVIAGHYDCAGNPENEDVQREQLRKAVKVIVSWKFKVKEVAALWLGENFKPDII